MSRRVKAHGRLRKTPVPRSAERARVGRREVERTAAVAALRGFCGKFKGAQFPVSTQGESVQWQELLEVWREDRRRKKVQICLF